MIERIFKVLRKIKFDYWWDSNALEFWHIQGSTHTFFLVSTVVMVLKNSDTCCPSSGPFVKAVQSALNRQRQSTNRKPPLNGGLLIHPMTGVVVANSPSVVVRW